MPEAQHDLELCGCTPEPLMAYLKALGVLRLVSEQADPEARGGWWNDTFWLRSTYDRDRLTNFFLMKYQPTPIVAPWAGGSGFFKKDNKKAVEALQESKTARVEAYRTVIQRVQSIIDAEKVGDKPRDAEKVRLIRRYRRELPDELVAWIDAAMVLETEGQRYAPILGTGGNDGRLDFTQNFMQRIVTLGFHSDSPPDADSATWLDTALFMSPSQLGSASVGQFAPGRAGGPNATQGMEGAASDNPWDFVFMLEGALLLGGTASKRLNTTDAGRAAFPFTVRTVAAGFDSSASKDESESRGELWLPVWTDPATIAELRQLFGEGRADVSGRPVRDGIDFARAVATLGVDRGIVEFSRLAFLKRSGKAYLATSLGRFVVREQREADLLHQIDQWLDRFRSACSADAPPRFGRALRAIDSAIFDFCRYGGKPLFQKILIALGRAERELALTPGRIGQSKRPSRPLAGLSADWIEAADDGSAEFAVARSLAFIQDQESKVGLLRANLEPVTIWYDSNERKQNAKWAEKDLAVVWIAADLPTNLANVLQRRMMDAGRAGCERLPLVSRFTTSLSTIAAFLAGDVDDERVERLIWGLMLVDPRRPDDQTATPYRGSTGTPMPPLPREYALLKLLFLPRPLAVQRQGESWRWRLAKPDEPGIAIRPEPRILPLIRAGRVGEACRIAAQRLRVSGLSPMPGSMPTGMMRDDNWAERTIDRRSALRLAAALLIPIPSMSINRLVRLVSRDQSAAVETLALAAEGVTE